MKYKIFYGAAALPDEVNESFVKSLPNFLESEKRQASLTFHLGIPTSGLYGWYALPVTLASKMSFASFIDDETKFAAGYALNSTITVDGIEYQVWKSNQKGLGTYIVNIR